MTNIAIRQNNPRNIERQAAARQIFSDVKVLMGISIFGRYCSNCYINNKFRIK